MARFISFHKHPVYVCKLVSANYCFQVKTSFEDRVIANILGKCRDVAWAIFLFHLFCSYTFAVFNMLWHNFEINKTVFEMADFVRFTEYLRAIFTSCLMPPKRASYLCFSYDCQVKRFHTVSRWQVKVYRRQISCIKANMRFTMPCICSGCWMGWSGWTYGEFSICYGLILKTIKQCLNWPTLYPLQNI